MDKKSKQDRKASVLKVTLIIKIVAIFAVVSLLAISKYMYNIKTAEFENNIYLDLIQQDLNQFEVVKKEKLVSTLLVTSSLVKDPSIKAALAKYDYLSVVSSFADSPIKKSILISDENLINFDSLLKSITKVKEYRRFKAFLINKDGKVIKRSWTLKYGDDLIRDNPRFEYYLKYPKILSSIDFDKFGLDFTNKFPVFDGKSFRIFCHKARY